MMHILERLMKGMTVDFALQRVFELESKQDVNINRKMMENYTKTLRKGLDKNQQKFLEVNNVTLD
jgi:hypothetical protein